MSQSAFPSGTDFYGGSNKEYGKRGMTLRDYFAAKAMQSLMITMPENGDESAPHERAAYAYEMADAMMKAREA